MIDTCNTFINRDGDSREKIFGLSVRGVSGIACLIHQDSCSWPLRLWRPLAFLLDGSMNRKKMGRASISFKRFN